MKLTVILLSGTPASGKDTLTNKLTELDDRFVHFRKHKINTGGKLDDTYYLISKEAFDSMAENGEFIQYHYRYDRGYGVSKEELVRLNSIGKIPIIHVGKYENIAKFRDAKLNGVMSVLLFTDKATTKKRLELRHPNNEDEINKRLTAYGEEIEQLKNVYLDNQLLDFNFIFKNNFDDLNLATDSLYDLIRKFEKNCLNINEILND